MQAIATWKGGFEAVLEDGRAHSVIVDLPASEGGHSSGTSALELCVLSLAGCITTSFAVVAHKRRLSVQGLSVALEAERPKGSPTIARIRGTVRIRTRSESSEVETTLRQVLRTCPVGVIFERAQIPVEVGVIVSVPAASGALSEVSSA